MLLENLVNFGYRTNRDSLHKAEMRIWDEPTRISLGDLPALLASTSLSLQARFAGNYGVIKAKFKENTFVEKLCASCGKGMHGEKLFACKKCALVYYCDKECQKAHWPAHKPVCRAADYV